MFTQRDDMFEYINTHDFTGLEKIQDHFLTRPRQDQDQDLNLQDQDKTKTSTLKTKTKTKTLRGKTKTRPRPQKIGLETVSRQDRSRDLTSLLLRWRFIVALLQLPLTCIEDLTSDSSSEGDVMDECVQRLNNLFSKFS